MDPAVEKQFIDALMLHNQQARDEMGIFQVNPRTMAQDRKDKVVIDRIDRRYQLLQTKRATMGRRFDAANADVKATRALLARHKDALRAAKEALDKANREFDEETKKLRDSNGGHFLYQDSWLERDADPVAWQVAHFSKLPDPEEPSGKWSLRELLEFDHDDFETMTPSEWDKYVVRLREVPGYDPTHYQLYMCGSSEYRYFTALHWAAYHGNVAMAQHLLQLCGCDSNRRILTQLKVRAKTNDKNITILELLEEVSDTLDADTVASLRILFAPYM